MLIYAYIQTGTRKWASFVLRRLVSILVVCGILAALLVGFPVYAVAGEGDVQVGAFGSRENALNMRDQLVQEGKDAFVGKKKVNGKVFHTVYVRGGVPPVAAKEVDKGTDSSPEALSPPGPMESVEAMPPPPPDDTMEYDEPVMAEEPEPVAEAEPEPEPYDNEPSGPIVVDIIGMDTEFEMELPPLARLYEGPSFKSTRVGFRKKAGKLEIYGQSSEGWVVVKSLETGKFWYIPPNDTRRYTLGKKRELIPNQ